MSTTSINTSLTNINLFPPPTSSLSCDETKQPQKQQQHQNNHNLLTTKQNSHSSIKIIPSPLINTRPPLPLVSGKTTIRLVHERLRRQSYDVRVLNPPLNSEGNSVITHCPLRPQRTSSARLNPSFTSPSLAGSSHYSIGSLVAKRRQSRPISYGYASAGFYIRRGPNDEEWLEEFDFDVCVDDNDEDEERRPSTSHSVDAEGDEECLSNTPTQQRYINEDETDKNNLKLDNNLMNGGNKLNNNNNNNSALSQLSSSSLLNPSSLPLQNGVEERNIILLSPSSQSSSPFPSTSPTPYRGKQNGNSNGGIYTRKHNNGINNQPMALFLLRQPDQRILPADQFIQSLSEKCRESIRKFLEKESPDDGECYLWVRDDVNMKTNILSLTFLQNHFKSEHIRRVKWRHLSVDKVSIYRYSLPVITTKFRLRFAHFLSRHYRCCILGVWCMVILCISVGIVLSVVFGSVPNSQKSNGTSIIPIQPVIQRSGGFMEDAIEMEQQQAVEIRNSDTGQLIPQFVGSHRAQPPGVPRGIININGKNVDREFQWLDDRKKRRRK
uniref:Uncharacterized protein n=3 Tax=Meloidogyne TaxID=189290 RepID=A0A915NJS5_9BILA